MTSAQPTDDQVLIALERSGFLFEQEIATLLEQNDFHVETSWPYLDPDTKKSREIDLRAIKNVLHSDEHKLQVFVEILVECKDSGSPLVFLERQKNRCELEQSSPRQYVFPRKMYHKSVGQNSYIDVPAFLHLELASSHYYFNHANKATQFSKIVRKGSDWVANHEGVYDSLFLPIAKALDARVKSLPRSGMAGDWRTVWLFFPVVVLRDHLLSLSISGSDKSLAPSGRITFVRNLDSDALKGEYLIDFVTAHHLQDYLDNDIGEFSKAVAELATSSASLVRGDDV